MKEAGKEECKLAIERNEYHEGVPATTVIVAGGWCKRSHRHTYNAKSGVGVVIGFHTHKILYIGVQNKECAACTRGIRDHICFKNWNESSSAMETDVIFWFRSKQKNLNCRFPKPTTIIVPSWMVC